MASVIVYLTDALKKLSGADSKLSDQTQFYRNLSELELSDTLLRFKAQKDPDGKKWPEPFTIRRDGEGGNRMDRDAAWGYVVSSNFHAVPPGYHFFDASRGDKILRDTGTLFDSLGVSFGKDYGIVGTNLEYAEKHQNGEGVQQRRFLGISKSTNNNVKQALSAYLKGLI